MLLKSHRFL